MRLKLLFFFLFPLLAFASPVRSNIGGEEVSRIDGDEPLNYWTWPDEQISASASPNSVWTPEVGKWYSRCANNGYFRLGSPYCEFGEDWVEIHTIPSGYSQGAFVWLEPGEYVFSCEMSATPNAISFMFYQEVDGGFQYSHRKSYSNKTSFEAALSITDECPLVMIWFDADRSNYGSMTVTDIQILRK